MTRGSNALPPNSIATETEDDALADAFNAHDESKLAAISRLQEKYWADAVAFVACIYRKAKSIPIEERGDVVDDAFRALRRLKKRIYTVNGSLFPLIKLQCRWVALRRIDEERRVCAQFEHRPPLNWVDGTMRDTWISISELKEELVSNFTIRKQPIVANVAEAMMNLIIDGETNGATPSNAAIMRYVKEKYHITITKSKIQEFVDQVLKCAKTILLDH